MIGPVGVLLPAFEPVCLSLPIDDSAPPRWSKPGIHSLFRHKAFSLELKTIFELLEAIPVPGKKLCPESDLLLQEFKKKKAFCIHSWLEKEARSDFAPLPL